MLRPRWMLLAATLLALAEAHRALAGQPQLAIQKALYQTADGETKADVTDRVKAMVRDGRLSLTVTNEALGGDPARGIPKQLRVEYTLDGKPLVAVAKEREVLELPAGLPLPPPDPQEQAAWALGVLKSDATRKQKADACRMLQRVGGKEAVGALAGLLADEESSHMARYALEAIPDPSVDAALREALGKTKGRQLAGVIHSIGMRRDPQAVQPLSAFLRDADKDVAAIAAAAIGRIGTPEAAQVLERALASPTPALYDGVLRCADALANAGQSAAAIALYARVRDSKALPYVRAAAIRGIVRAKGAEGPAYLAEQLRTPDLLLFAAMLHLAQSELPGKEFTLALAGEVGGQQGERKAMLVQALGARGDEAAVPALGALAAAGEKPLRLCAISALAQIAKPAVAPALAKLANDPDADIARAATEAMASLPGTETDAAYLAMLDGPEAARKLTGIQMVARRRVREAVPALLKLAGDPDATLRGAALQALRDMASEAELPALLGLIAKAETGPDTEALGQAITAACRAAAQPDACAEKVIAALPAAPTPTKIALLRVLSAVGGQKPLETVKAAVADPDDKVKAAAIRSLATWRDAEAAKYLVELAKSLPNAADRLLCLQGCLNLAANAQLPPGQRLAVCRQAAPLIEREQEKKLLLGTLGGIPAVEALAEILPHLDAAATRAEASMAAMNVAEALLRGRPAPAVARKLVAPLQKVAAANAATPELGERAKMLLRKAQAASGTKR